LDGHREERGHSRSRAGRGFLRLELSDAYIVGKCYNVNKHPTPEAQGALFDTLRLDYKGDKSLQ
jgi:hypothetical protein